MNRIIRLNCADTPNKVAVIKLVRAASGLGLKEAKDLVEETMGGDSSQVSEIDGRWGSDDEFARWHRDMIGNGVTIVSDLDPNGSKLAPETTERLVGNAQQLIIDCIMERAWNMARDLIDVLERHDKT